LKIFIDDDDDDDADDDDDDDDDDVDVDVDDDDVDDDSTRFTTFTAHTKKAGQQARARRGVWP